MRQVLGWMAVAIICCATRTVAGEEKPDARLREAQTAYDEALMLWDAGKYADATAKGEQALALREDVLGSAHPDEPHPHYWAPFIALGRDAPMRNLLPTLQELPRP
jgi:hypothetical protein